MLAQNYDPTWCAHSIWYAARFFPWLFFLLRVQSYSIPESHDTLLRSFWTKLGHQRRTCSFIWYVFEEFTFFGSLTMISCFNMKNYHSKSPARLCANTAKTSPASTILKLLVWLAHHQVFKLSCLLMQHMPQLVAPWLEPLTSNARVSLVKSGVSGVARHVALLSEWSETSSSISECAFSAYVWSLYFQSIHAFSFIFGFV